MEFKFIRTYNVESNKGILSFNLRVGFKFMPYWLIFDKVLKGGG